MLKVLTEGCDPTRGTKYSACVDLYASEDVTIGAGETKLVGLGVAIDFDKLNEIILNRELLNLVGAENMGHPSVEEDAFIEAWLSAHYLQLMLRSSLSKHLVIANGVGVIDLDYKDEIKIRLHNPLKTYEKKDEDIIWSDRQILVNEKKKIKKGDRIAQITLVEHKSYLFGVKSDAERDGGFGSTDKKKD